MKIYWDSSALVEATMDKGIRNRLRSEEACTRLHSLAEVFSTLTGGRLGFRIDAGDAAELIDEIRNDLEIILLDLPIVIETLRQARENGVRGGRVHDFLHAAAARHARCSALRTLNTRDFEGIRKGMELLPP